MKTFCKVFAPIYLTFVLGFSIHAGELNSPPAPSPTPGTSAPTTSAPLVAGSTSSGANPLEVDTAWTVLINLISMLSIH